MLIIIFQLKDHYKYSAKLQKANLRLTRKRYLKRHGESKKNPCEPHSNLDISDIDYTSSHTDLQQFLPEELDPMFVRRRRRSLIPQDHAEEKKEKLKNSHSHKEIILLDSHHQHNDHTIVSNKNLSKNKAIRTIKAKGILNSRNRCPICQETRQNPITRLITRNNDDSINYELSAKEKIDIRNINGNGKPFKISESNDSKRETTVLFNTKRKDTIDHNMNPQIDEQLTQQFLTSGDESQRKRICLTHSDYRMKLVFESWKHVNTLTNIFEYLVKLSWIRKQRKPLRQLKGMTHTFDV